MRYICLVHFDISLLLNATPEVQQDINRRSLAYDQKLAREGRYVISQAIEGPDNAVLLRRRDGRLSATDGPFMETKEAMAGFILVEAADMDEAVEIAAGIPLAEIGTIEVRPIYVIPGRPEL